MFRLVIATSCLVVVFSSPLGEEWESYKIKYRKTYMNEKEELYRHSIWAENVEYISKHNKEYELGLHTFTMGMNKYTDMSHKEFVSMMNGYRASNSNISMQSYSPQKNDPLPSSVDWRPEGYVTPVKDQGDCGSCWAFSTTGSLEGQWFKKTGTLISLSEQNLIDCSTENDGCNGGNVALALNYVKENNGIDTEQSYPYEAKQGPCRYDAANRGATCTGYVGITAGDEFTLQYCVATVGPVSVAIDASHDSFQHYSGGVYHEPSCSTTTLDHAVLVVGYDTATTGEEYYIVKNSWNDGWGDKGYIYMPRNSNNYCGIASAAVYPTV